MKKYSKRDFLKLMGGLSLGLLPFAGCYTKDEKNDSSQNVNSKSGDTSTINQQTSSTKKEYSFTDEDVVLLSRNDVQFAKENIYYNRRIKKLPKYIAVCKTTLGVQYAIQKAKSENLPIAIKSGGHSFEGFSSNNGGMVINVTNMKKVTWENDNEVWVEPGCLLREMQDKIYAKGKLLPAGSCGGVGIAGLALGGGYGLFSREFGLTCDSLLSIKMITADEEEKEFSGTDEMIWACKGAGNGNFGVVTGLKFKTYPLPKTFSAYNIYHQKTNVDNFKNLLREWFDVCNKLPNSAFSAFVLNGKTAMILLTNTNGILSESIFENLKENQTKYSASPQKETVSAIKRFYGRKDPMYFKNSSCGYFNKYEELEQSLDEIFSIVSTNSGMIFQINTLGGKINDESFKTNAAYPHRDMNFLGELQYYYESPSRETKALTAFEQVQTLLKKNGISKHYRNYPDINFENWQFAYYGDNYPKLQSIKSKYDPGNLFRYEQSVEGK